MKYTAMAACERFGIDPAVFRRKTVDEQVELMAYELVRTREEGAGADPQ